MLLLLTLLLLLLLVLTTLLLEAIVGTVSCIKLLLLPVTLLSESVVLETGSNFSGSKEASPSSKETWRSLLSTVWTILASLSTLPATGTVFCDIVRREIGMKTWLKSSEISSSRYAH